MASKKQVGIPLAILTVIAGIAGGHYAFDFSSTVTNTNVDSSGDEITNFFGDISDDFAYEATMTAICSKTPIEPEYVDACAEWELED